MEKEFTIYIDRKVVAWQRTTYNITPLDGQTREDALEIIKQRFIEDPEYLEEGDMVEWCDDNLELEDGYLIDYDGQPTSILYQVIPDENWPGSYNIEEIEDNTPMEVRRQKKLNNLLK